MYGSSEAIEQWPSVVVVQCHTVDNVAHVMLLAPSQPLSVLVNVEVAANLGEVANPAQLAKLLRDHTVLSCFSELLHAPSHRVGTPFLHFPAVVERSLEKLDILHLFHRVRPQVREFVDGVEEDVVYDSRLRFCIL